jgi:ferredoxin-NADP reductase/nitrite reductase/ring-hydroxylating ferredoxin subunit
MDGLAALAENLGDGTLRTAYDQGIVIPNIASVARATAVRALNRVGLEHEADSITRNIIACTGRQFCNIAVSETKGHAFALMDTLRAKGVKLGGIKINMSGCPSSCAQTYTADIGLKGVRVRRRSSSQDAFDVYLGGGVGSRVELGQLYRKGVDLDQMPELIAALVRTFDESHSPGQTFSQFWRERLANGHEPSPLAAEEFCPPVWQCEACNHKHSGEDPPVFCPKCAALRRNFVRLGDDALSAESNPAGFLSDGFSVTHRADVDGFHEVATLASLQRDGRRAVQVDGHELALFLVGSEVRCIDGLCPHEGGPLAQGDLAKGVVSCPWHGWSFHCDSGRAGDGNGCSLQTYPVKIEDDRVLVAFDSTSKSAAGASEEGVVLRVLAVIQETPDVKTIKLDNRARQVPVHQPGQHIKVCAQVPGGQAWRGFTISSPPTRPDVLELTVKRNPSGTVSNWIHSLDAGADMRIKGPHGKFVFDPEIHKEPLILAAAGSGITPAMSILRTILDLQLEQPVTLLYGSRTRGDVIFARELDALRLRLATFRLVLTLTLADQEWNGSVGRVSPALFHRHVPEPEAARYFLCGPGDFTETLSVWLREHGVAADRIASEKFGERPRIRSAPAIPAWASSVEPAPVPG